MGCGNGIATAHRKQKFFCCFFFKKSSACLLACVLALPAQAQTQPNAANDCGVISTPSHPGEAPGGNIFASHIGQPQPQDAPNDEVATYPDITQTTPDHTIPEQVQPDPSPNQPFAFSGSINNPVLSQSNAPEQSYAAPKKGC